MTNVASFMTNHIRHIPSSSFGGTPGRAYVFGEVWHNEIHFSINKRYAFYPGFLLLAAIVFFAATVIRTRGEPIWKNSQLALLYHGFAGGTGCHGNLDTVAAMEVSGKRVKAVLKDDHDGLGLRLRLDGKKNFLWWHRRNRRDTFPRRRRRLGRITRGKMKQFWKRGQWCSRRKSAAW